MVHFLPPPPFYFIQHLIEKSWYMVLETFILLAGFHEDMQVSFVATITFLFAVKAFHWLIEERINYVSIMALNVLIQMYIHNSLNQCQYRQAHIVCVHVYVCTWLVTSAE